MITEENVFYDGYILYYSNEVSSNILNIKFRW